jgi:hypothetical protein
VVQDAESYQQILNRLERLGPVEAIRLSIATAGKGHVTLARKALAQLKERLGISG